MQKNLRIFGIPGNNNNNNNNNYNIKKITGKFMICKLTPLFYIYETKTGGILQLRESRPPQSVRMFQNDHKAAYRTLRNEME